MIKPVHPDFLVYWTGGKDIDKKDNWKRNDNCVLNRKLCEKYLKRLEGILRFGLWLKRSKKDSGVSQICFTELKLSEARLHAKRYGRLGIGFKRTYLFDRLGRPVVYYHPKRQENDWFRKNLSQSCSKHALGRFLKAFLKKMSDKTDPYGYECLHESEWRIIWSDEIEKYLKENEIFWQEDTRFTSSPRKLEYSEFFRKPKSVDGFETWCKENKIPECEWPDYLMPLTEPGRIYSEWLHLIIYPDIRVKAMAHSEQYEETIGKHLRAMKLPLPKKAPTWGKETRPWEPYTPLIELDLDSCRNF